MCILHHPSTTVCTCSKGTVHGYFQPPPPAPSLPWIHNLPPPTPSVGAIATPIRWILHDPFVIPQFDTTLDHLQTPRLNPSDAPGGGMQHRRSAHRDRFPIPNVAPSRIPSDPIQRPMPFHTPSLMLTRIHSRKAPISPLFSPFSARDRARLREISRDLNLGRVGSRVSKK